MSILSNREISIIHYRKGFYDLTNYYKDTIFDLFFSKDLYMMISISQTKKFVYCMPNNAMYIPVFAYFPFLA
jgi:hypothetical protein